MTLFSHHAIDALSGKRPELMFDDCNPHVTPEYRAEVMKGIRIAAKFDFGKLHFEPSSTDPHKLTMPALTVDEMGFWADGMLPLPDVFNWFEFRLNESRSGILVFEEESRLYSTRLDYIDGRVNVVPIFAVLNPMDYRSNGKVAVKLFGPDEIITLLETRYPDLYDSMASDAALVLYLLLMLNSRTTEKSRTVADVRLNRSRVKRGRTPLADHTVVTIVPERFRKGPSQGGTHASPRLHWRRSHLRRYDRETPNAKWNDVEQCWMVLIPRQLVGRAELGEMTHEYRVLERR